jgi:drug/metabolite transporter (DMT)-like permease
MKTVLWTTSLALMGAACLINASRCGRIHCRFTGPFLILCAVASLGYGLGLLSLGPSGWKWIGAVTIIGAIALTCIPELVLGRYRRNGTDAA